MPHYYDTLVDDAVVEPSASLLLASRYNRLSNHDSRQLVIQTSSRRILLRKFSVGHFWSSDFCGLPQPSTVLTP